MFESLELYSIYTPDSRAVCIPFLRKSMFQSLKQELNVIML